MHAIYFISYLLIKEHKLLECGSEDQSHCMLRLDHSIALPEGSRIVGSVFSEAVITIKYG